MGKTYTITECNVSLSTEHLKSVPKVKNPAKQLVIFSAQSYITNYFFIIFQFPRNPYYKCWLAYDFPSLPIPHLFETPIVYRFELPCLYISFLFALLPIPPFMLLTADYDNHSLFAHIYSFNKCVMNTCYVPLGLWQPKAEIPYPESILVQRDQTVPSRPTRPAYKNHFPKNHDGDYVIVQKPLGSLYFEISDVSWTSPKVSP